MEVDRHQGSLAHHRRASQDQEVTNLVDPPGVGEDQGVGLVTGDLAEEAPWAEVVMEDPHLAWDEEDLLERASMDHQWVKGALMGHQWAEAMGLLEDSMDHQVDLVMILPREEMVPQTKGDSTVRLWAMMVHHTMTDHHSKEMDHQAVTTLQAMTEKMVPQAEKMRTLTGHREVVSLDQEEEMMAMVLLVVAGMTTNSALPGEVVEDPGEDS